MHGNLIKGADKKQPSSSFYMGAYSMEDANAW